jgi:hypothetical protein
MTKKSLNKLFLKKNFFYFIIFFVFLIQSYQGFLNVYVILNKNYEERMINTGGHCSNQGYGFIKFIHKNYKKLLDENIPVKSYIDSATAEAYFYNVKKKNSNEYLIIISDQKENIKNINLNDYHIIYNEFNCYFLKKK